MTRLNDYMRAEQPDKTEPASFYVPGAENWKMARAKRQPAPGGTDEDDVALEPIEEVIDIQELSESAAAQEAAALKED